MSVVVALFDCQDGYDDMDFLDLPFNILRCVGIFPLCTTSKWKSRGFDIYRVFVFGLLATTIILMTVQMWVSPDLSVLARTIDMWTMFLSGLYKWCCIILSNKRFANLQTTLANIQEQGSAAYGSSANRFTENYLKRTKRVTGWYMFSGFFGAILLTASPFLTYSQRNRSDFEYFNDPKNYPVMLWIPFAVNDKWMFVALITCLCFALLLTAAIYLGIDSYMFGSIYAIGGQIELLKSSINNIENALATDFVDVNSLCANNESMSFTEEQQNQCYSILRECAKHHIQILCYIRDIRKQFSSLIIVDYVHGLTSLSFAMFQLSNSVGIGEVISVMFFIFVCISHQFLNNFFGEFIIQKQLSVGSTLYNVQWWRANKKIRYVLTLMIMRSMKPNFITGFYMYKMCNESFLKFVKALYTYYMVLRRVNTKDNNM